MTCSTLYTMRLPTMPPAHRATWSLALGLNGLAFSLPVIACPAHIQGG